LNGVTLRVPPSAFEKRLYKKSKMKRVYLIHGWHGSSENDLFSWLSEELTKKGFEVKTFDMPNSFHPKIEEWVDFLHKEISNEEMDENTYFVGHSIGAQTIMRFLEKSHKHKKIGGCVFIAGWFKLVDLEPEELEIAHPWQETPIDFERVLDHCNNFLAIFSKDDKNVHIEEADKFKENLGAKIIIKENMGHFNKIKKIPEILNFIK